MDYAPVDVIYLCEENSASIGRKYDVSVCGSSNVPAAARPRTALENRIVDTVRLLPIMPYNGVIQRVMRVTFRSGSG